MMMQSKPNGHHQYEKSSRIRPPSPAAIVRNRIGGAKEEEKTEIIGGSEAHPAACSSSSGISVPRETRDCLRQEKKIEENITNIDFHQNDVLLGRGKIADIEDVCEYYIS
jgi:hypothetical protein